MKMISVGLSIYGLSLALKQIHFKGSYLLSARVPIALEDIIYLYSMK